MRTMLILALALTGCATQPMSPADQALMQQLLLGAVVAQPVQTETPAPITHELKCHLVDGGWNGPNVKCEEQ